ncbi:MAG: 4Fe-4S binding protein [Bellilinea sp.]
MGAMEKAASYRFDLTRYAWVRRLLTSRWPQFILRAVTLAGFMLVILTGFIGSPVGSRNFAVMFVWIAWWSALKLIMLPFGGRVWCSICPIPMPGEWLQQGWLVKPGGKKFNLGLRWPRRLRNTWLQSAGFAAIGLFSALTLTTPVVTAWIFVGLIIVAVVVSVVFEQRSFCRYLCPMGGFIGLYATMAPLELRPQPDLTSVEKGAAVREWPRGCPWINNPAALKANANCGLCLECLRTESGESMALNARSFDAELGQPGAFRLDEAFLSLGLLGSVMIYSAVFQGPWGALKNAALYAGSPAWWGFAAFFLLTSFGLLPALLAGVSALVRRTGNLGQPLQMVFTRFSRALLPLGLLSWIAFTVSFAFGKMAYLWPVLSDPFGWGWNLFGTAAVEWQPYLLNATPVIEAVLLVAGLIWSGRTVLKTAGQLGVRGERRWAAAPVLLFALAGTLILLWLLIG